MTQLDCLFISSSKAKALQFSIYPYLGIGYLSTAMKQINLSTALFDLDVHHGRLKKLFKEIENRKPLIVGYSIMSISLPVFYKITKELKRRFPDLIIVAGGPHITSDPSIISDMGIDYGFVGHSEKSFPLFVERVKNNYFDFSDIQGMIIPKENRYDKAAFYDVEKSNLAPDYSLYDFSKYQNIFYGRKWFSIITSRGCAYNCKFCKDPGKNKYREYPFENIIEQIRFLVNEKGIEWLSFVDDTFTYNRERILKLCQWIKDEKIDFKWTCCTRADTLDEELIKTMYDAGFRYAILGVEAGDEEIRKQINKNISNAEYIHIINSLKENGVRVLCSYVLGNPNETYEQIYETINFSLKLKADYAQYYNMTALPQSPIFRYGIDSKIFGERVWTEYMKGERDLPYYIPQGLELKTLKRIRKTAFLRYYLRPKHFFDMGFRFVKFLFDITIIKKLR